MSNPTEIEQNPAVEKAPETGCDCVKKCDDALKEKYGPSAYLVTVMWGSIHTEFKASFPPIYFYAHVPNKDGTPSSKMRKAFFGMLFCPMCGKKK